VLDRKRELDMREIMRIFEDYKRVEDSVATRLLS
jgi:hypothetical protein